MRKSNTICILLCMFQLFSVVDKFVCVWALGSPSLRGTSRTMACLQNLLLNIRHEVEHQLRGILEDIAQEYGLDSRTLVGKYILHGEKDLSPVTLQTYPQAQVQVPEIQTKPQVQVQIPEGLPQVPQTQGKKKGGRKPKFSTPPKLDGELTEGFLQGLTIPLLKDACKMRKLPITGGKDVLIERIQEHQRNPQPPGEKKKGGRKKKVLDQEPGHNHALDNQTHSDCPQCETYGNPMDPKMQEETFEIAASTSNTVISHTTAEPKEFDMGDEDIDDQLKNIVAQMNQIEIEEEPEDEPEDEDPFDQVDYGDELEEED